MDTSYVIDLGALVALLIVPGVVSLVRVWARTGQLERDVLTLEQKINAVDSDLSQIEKRLEALDERFAGVMIELSRINVKLDILLPKHTERER